MPKISARKLILCELLRLNFKRKNNIKRRRLWMWQIFMGRHLKGGFPVLSTSSSSSTLLLDILFSHSDASVFVLFNNLLHSAI